MVMSTKVKFFESSEFHNKAVLEQAVSVNILGYITGDGIVENKNNYSCFSKQPEMVVVEMTFSDNKSLEGQCFISDVAGHIIGGCKATTELWGGQLKLALFPDSYVW
jgi:hypothetical protein